MIMLMNGDRVFHRNRQEFGTITDVVGLDPTSSIVLFDDGDLGSGVELEVTTALLVKILSEHHENLLKETYDL